jgi:histidine decarboxylase
MAKTRSVASGMSLADVVDGAVGPAEHYCMGYLNPGASGLGYISTLKLSTGLVKVAGLDPGTEGIVSYDRCEKNDAYIGQINMLTASSFCGVNGAVWGYHLAVADEIANKTLQPMFYQSGDGRLAIPVYPVSPLLECARRLFGVEAQRRFPPMPGAHVICANKNYTTDLKDGPTWVWSAIALAIAEDRDSEANLFIEDAGNYGTILDGPPQIKKFLDETLHAVTKSMVLCGVDQGVRYKEIYAGYVYQFADRNQVGCALTCAPYVLLAKNAIPPGMQAEQLLGMPISKWEKLLNLPPLPPQQRQDESGTAPEKKAG